MPQVTVLNKYALGSAPTQRVAPDQAVPTRLLFQGRRLNRRGLHRRRHFAVGAAYLVVQIVRHDRSPKTR